MLSAAKWSSWKIELKEPMDLCAICVGQQGMGGGKEKTIESLLDCKEIKPVNPKGNQS